MFRVRFDVLLVCGGKADIDEGEIMKGVVVGRRGKKGMVDDTEADFDWEVEEVGLGGSWVGRRDGLGRGWGGGLYVHNVHGDGYRWTPLMFWRRSL